MKTLKIHIGHFKTGTTALQVFCSRHPDMLAAQGIEYPTTLRHHNAKHSAFAFALYRAAGVETLMHGYADPIAPEDMWRELFDHVRASKHPVTLISSEEFMRVGAHPEAERRLAGIIRDQAEGIRIQIIAYLRPPQSHLRSWFNQLVKMNQKVPDFNSALGEIEPVHYDYAAAIRPWSAIFGRENVMLRRYPDRFEHPGDLVEDFLTALGVTRPAHVPLPEGDPNPRLDDRIIDTLRLMQNLGLPRHMINTVRDQASVYVEMQDQYGAEGLPAVARARAAAAEGIAALPDLAEASFDLADLGQALPEPEEAERVVDRMMAGFVLSELLALRRRLNRMKLTELVERVDRLEGRLGMAADEAERET